LGIGHKKINTDNIGHKTKTNRHGKHWAQETGYIGHKKRVTLGTRHRTIDTGYIGHKKQKDRHVYV
jgi:hypothetical protein